MLTAFIDNCTPRRNSTGGEYSRVPPTPTLQPIKVPPTHTITISPTLIQPTPAVTHTPTQTPSLIPPTRTLTPTKQATAAQSYPTQASGSNPSPDEILGNWQPLGGMDAMFLQLNSDGTCQQAFTLAGLKNAPDTK
jgi:hypothetical protein